MMDNIAHENKDYSNDIEYHLGQLQSDLYRMQIGNNRNFILSKSIDILVENIEMIKKLAQAEVRFDWLKIQDEIDRLFKDDNSITGYIINFDFKESEKPNRCMIPVKIIKEDENGK